MMILTKPAPAEKSVGPTSPHPPGLGRRLLWLVAIWAASILALGLVAAPIRWVLKAG